jgi:hypothetical protein
MRRPCPTSDGRGVETQRHGPDDREHEASPATRPAAMQLLRRTRLEVRHAAPLPGKPGRSRRADAAPVSRHVPMVRRIRSPAGHLSQLGTIAQPRSRYTVTANRAPGCARHTSSTASEDPAVNPPGRRASSADTTSSVAARRGAGQERRCRRAAVTGGRAGLVPSLMLARQRSAATRARRRTTAALHAGQVWPQTIELGELTITGLVASAARAEASR